MLACVWELEPARHGDLPSFHLQQFHLIPVPRDGRVAEDVEELAPKLQVSGGIWEGLSPDLANNLRSW